MGTFLITGNCCGTFVGTVLVLVGNLVGGILVVDLVGDFVGTLRGSVLARYVDCDGLADGVEGRGAGALGEVLGGARPTHYVDCGHLCPLVGGHRVHPQESAKEIWY